MASATRAKRRKTPTRFDSSSARYATLVREVRKFAAARVTILEKEMAALERVARTSAATYIRRVVKELRRFEAELLRLEKMVAPAARRAGKARAKKPTPLQAVHPETAA